MLKIETNEPYPPLLNTTIDLSVRGDFLVGTRSDRPVCGSLLLTIEWE
jgi:hypothetical protein